MNKQRHPNEQLFHVCINKEYAWLTVSCWAMSKEHAFGIVLKWWNSSAEVTH